MGGGEVIEDVEPDHYADDESSDSEDNDSISAETEPDYFVPGYFTILITTVVKYKAVVSSSVIRTINPGDEVFIRSVIKVNNRLRGKLRKGGWISIINHSTNTTFAERKPDKDFEIIPKKKPRNDCKRVTFAPTSRSLRALKRNSVTSLCDGLQHSLAELANEAAKQCKKREPSTTASADPVWYQRYYYDVESDSDSESSSGESFEEPCLKNTDCVKRIPDLDREDVESLPEIPSSVDNVKRAPCKELKVKITEIQDNGACNERKCSEDSSANVGNFSSPSIDLQSSEDFSFQAESMPSSSEDEYVGEERPLTYGWTTQFEKTVFHKNFDRDVFLKSLQESRFPPPPAMSMNGTSHPNPTRVVTASFKPPPCSTPSPSCGGADDEQSSSKSMPGYRRLKSILKDYLYFFSTLLIRIKN